MKHSSSTLLTRLALALLAVLGFVAPLSAVEGDRVVQTTGGKPSPEAKVEQRHSPPAPTALPSSTPLQASRTLPRVERSARRYLLHRAWLL